MTHRVSGATHEIPGRSRALTRLMAGLASTVLISTALLGTTSGSASANQVRPSTCPIGYLCGYANEGWKLGPATFFDANNKWSAFSTGYCGNGNWNDCVTSVYNASQCYNAWLYEKDNLTGTYHTLRPMDGYIDLRNINFSDKISSNTWVPAC